VRILITTDYLVPDDHVDHLLRQHGHDTVHSPATGTRSTGELADLLAHADAALVASEPITASMLDVAPSLKVIARTGVGYDAIDVDAATVRGIYVCNTPGANRHAVAEMTLTLLLTCARRIGETLHGIREGRWPRHDTSELRGSTLGVIGVGPSGRTVVELAHAFGMTIMATTAHPEPTLTDRYGVEFVSLDELLVSSDFVTLHARPSPANTHLINARSLAMMKDTAYLVNTARGSLIEETALIDAVRTGQIAGAALDVVDTEPLPVNSPLRDLPNIVITSHLAGQTGEARANASHAAAEDILRVLEGIKPVNAINGDALRTVRSGSRPS
jgi:phosphoglycerate dehydrogenase-like enzyme